MRVACIIYKHIDPAELFHYICHNRLHISFVFAIHCNRHKQIGFLTEYKNNLEYAKKNSEHEQYPQSLELCDKCGAFIRHSISECGVLPDWSGMESIITDMAEKYRDDFGYDYNEDMQGYIDDHEDEIKEITDKYLYSDIYVDKGNVSDFTGRIMIVRPEHINSRDVIPENQLFLAQGDLAATPRITEAR